MLHQNKLHKQAYSQCLMRPLGGIYEKESRLLSYIKLQVGVRVNDMRCLLGETQKRKQHGSQ